MKTTNKHNLPEAIYRAVSKNYPLDPDRLSVTHLIGPPLIRQLMIERWDELEEDASEKLWMLLGSAMHYILSLNADGIVEEKFEYEVNGITVVAKIDLYIPRRQLNGTTCPAQVCDHKTKTIWGHILGDAKEIEAQLNCYAWAERLYGRPVDELYANAILRDHNKRQAQREADYPPIAFDTYPVPLWDFETQQRYIEERVALHLEPATECTPEEKWARPTRYAVKKGKNKTAMRVKGLDTYEKAQAYIDKLPESKKKGTWIEARPGEFTRCKDYCPVRSVCPYNHYREIENG